jgi:hypothetical protein
MLLQLALRSALLNCGDLRERFTGILYSRRHDAESGPVATLQRQAIREEFGEAWIKLKGLGDDEDKNTTNGQ